MSRIKNSIKVLINFLVDLYLNAFVLTRSRRLSYKNLISLNEFTDNNVNRITFSLIYYCRIVLNYFLFYIIFFSILQSFMSIDDICVLDNVSNFKNRIIFIVTTSLYMIGLFILIAKCSDIFYLTIRYIKKK